MATNYNPRTVTNDLTLCLDAGNIKGYDKYENLLTYSEDFGNAGWLKQSVGTALAPVVTTNQGTAPDGTPTADKVVFDLNGSVTANDRSQLYQIFSTVTGTTYTFSTWMRSEDGVSRIVRISFSGVSPLDVVVTSSWQRFSVTATAIDTIRYPRYELRVGTPTSTFASVYIWGAQLEESSAVTDYTPTTTTAKIRGTTLTDLSGRGNNGTLTSGPTYDNSGSIVFDGTDDHIACSVIPRSTSMSLEVWFNASSVSAARQYLYTQQRDTPVLALYAYQERQGCQLELNRAAFQYFNDVNNSFIVTTDAIIQPNTWYQFVATLNGSSYQLYLNGLPTNMNPNTTDNSFLSTNPQSKTFTPNEAFIARRADGQGEDRFTGKIAIVKEYSRALTADEVRQNFNALRNRFGI